MKILVNVTDRRIMKGLECNPTKCPVILAIRAHKGCEKLMTCGVDVTKKRGRVVAILPAHVQAWIKRYDKTGWNVPIKFTLDLDL
jgi:hypothetical protein